MTAHTVKSSPSDRPPPSLISPSPCTAWATNLGLHLNGSNCGELVSMMKSAAGTVVGAAALKAARAAVVHFADLHAQISSIQGHDTAPAPHMPT